MKRNLLLILSFTLLGIWVMGAPVLFGLAASKNWAIHRFLQRHQVGLHWVQAMLMAGCAILSWVGHRRYWWIGLTFNGAAAVLAAALAIYLSGRRRSPTC